MERRPYFELIFRPNVELVSVVRRFTSSFYERVLNDADATSRVALATHELLENAVKYSSDGETAIRIGVERGVELSDGPALVRVSTTNNTDPENIALAVRIIDAINAAGDPFTFLQQAMRETAKRDFGSGLGLARICAEGEMAMRYEVEGLKLSIVAEMTV